MIQAIDGGGAALSATGSAPATAAAHASKMKARAVFISCSSCDQPPDGFEHFSSGIGLAEVSRTASSFGRSALSRIVASGHVDEKSVPPPAMSRWPSSMSN
jgi:hypothetical protein